MGLKDEVKLVIDGHFPVLPATRRSSKDANDTMTQANELYASAIDAKQDRLPPRQIGSALRPLNTAFKCSDARDCQVSYSIDIGCSSPLGAVGQSGSVLLEMAKDAAFTQGIVTISQATQSAGGILNLTTTGTANVSGVVPAGFYARLRTINNVGTPQYSPRSAQEVLL